LGKLFTQVCDHGILGKMCVNDAMESHSLTHSLPHMHRHTASTVRI